MARGLCRPPHGKRAHLRLPEAQRVHLRIHFHYGRDFASRGGSVWPASAFLLPKKPHGRLFWSGLGDSQECTQAGVTRHPLSPLHLAGPTGLHRRQARRHSTNPPHPERGCAKSLAGALGDHHPLPPLSVGELPATRRTHHRWDHLHPLLRVLPTNRRQTRNQLQQEETSRWEEGKKRKTPEEELPEIGLRPSSTAPHRRPNSPRTTDPNRQGTGPIHSVVRSRETASTDDPFKTTEFTSQAYAP